MTGGAEARGRAPDEENSHAPFGFFLDYGSQHELHHSGVLLVRKDETGTFLRYFARVDVAWVGPP